MRMDKKKTMDAEDGKSTMYKKRDVGVSNRKHKKRRRSATLMPATNQTKIDENESIKDWPIGIASGYIPCEIVSSRERENRYRQKK